MVLPLDRSDKLDKTDSMEKNKKNLHPQNRFNRPYDLQQLVNTVPELSSYITTKLDQKYSVDFSDPQAVFLLNKALLESEYAIKDWNILPGSLCPPVPSRLNYIHYLSDILGERNTPVRVVDIGTGSNLIYPILGHLEKGWDFIATEIHLPSIQHAKQFLSKNKTLKNHIQIRHQQDKERILQGVLKSEEYIDAVLCNPPFFRSAAEYQQNLQRKNQKLYGQASSTVKSNFQGLGNELWYPGGEKKFILKLIYESLELKDQIGICSSLVSNKDHLKSLIAVLDYHGVQHQIIPLAQGNKVSRLLYWHLNG